MNFTQDLGCVVLSSNKSLQVTFAQALGVKKNIEKT